MKEPGPPSTDRWHQLVKDRMLFTYVVAVKARNTGWLDWRTDSYGNSIEDERSTRILEVGEVR